MPFQKPDCSLSDHLVNWIECIHWQALSGAVLSDRFFLQQFIMTMQPVLRAALGGNLENEARQFPLHQASPSTFAPEHLLSRLMERCVFVGRPNLVSDTPRSILASSQGLAARAIEQDEGHHPVCSPVSDQPALDDDTDAGSQPPVFDMIVAALREKRDHRNCFLCEDPNHMSSNCPRLPALRANPTACRLLCRLLNAAEGKPFWSQHSGQREAVDYSSARKCS